MATAFQADAFQNNAFQIDAGGPTTPAYGPTTTATLILELEGGCKVSLEWATDVHKAWNGVEQRHGTLGAPRVKLDGVALLVDGDDRAYRAKLIAKAQTGAPFLLGLPYEELTVSSDVGGTSVSVYSTTLADWLQPGQRAIVLDIDEVATEVVVQPGSTSTSVAVSPSVTCKRGGRIMPAVAVYLQPQQGMGRHVVGLTEWHLSARSAEYGYAGVDAMGVGASLTTWYDPVDSYGWRVWTRRDIDDQVDDSMQSHAEIIDLGGMPTSIGSALEPDWGRQVVYTGSALEWQWLKAFLFATRGRQLAWLLPTWRPDMVYVSVAGASIRVQSASAAGGGDILATYAASPTHDRVLLLYASGATDFVRISEMADNLDGTVTMNVDHAPAASPVLMCWLERVRWESDSHEVAWESDRFKFAALARVVQQ